MGEHLKTDVARKNWGGVNTDIMGRVMNEEQKAVFVRHKKMRALFSRWKYYLGKEWPLARLMSDAEKVLR